MFIGKNLLRNIWERYYCLVSFCGRIQGASQLLILMNLQNIKVLSVVGLGAFLVERSLFPENERYDQERSHRSKKTNAWNAFLNIDRTISKRTERNGNCLKRTVKIINAFLFSRTRSKLGTHFNSGMCFQFRFSLYVVNRN